MLVTKDEIKNAIGLYNDVVFSTQKKCEGFLSTMLLSDGSRIDLRGPDGCPQMSVNYDGGNHPEYSSNVYSDVRSVFNKNGKFYVEIEDDDEYSIDNLSTAELVYLCELLLSSFNHF